MKIFLLATFITPVILTTPNYEAIDAAGFESIDNSDQFTLDEILINSFNLTKSNSECDVQISTLLSQRVAKSRTQPVIPLYINIKLILITLNSISDAQGTVSLTARLDFRWYDDRLKLSPPANETCKGHTLLSKAEDHVWFPHFILQNGAKQVFYPEAWEKFPLSVRADGYVDWRMAFQLVLSWFVH